MLPYVSTTLPTQPQRVGTSMSGHRNVVRIRVHGNGSEKLIGNGCLGWRRLRMLSKNRNNEMVVPKFAIATHGPQSANQSPQANASCCFAGMGPKQDVLEFMCLSSNLKVLGRSHRGGGVIERGWGQHAPPPPQPTSVVFWLPSPNQLEAFSHQ